MRRESGIHRWGAALLAGLVFGVVYGLTEGFTIFSTAFTKEFGVSKGSAATIYVLYLVVSILLAPLAGRAVDKFGPRRIIVPAFWVFGAGIAVCATATALWQLYLYYGFLIGTSSAFLITSAEVLVRNGDSDSRGKAIGIGYACLGAGDFVLFSALSQVVELAGWRIAYVVAGVVAVLAGSAFFLFGRTTAPAVPDPGPDTGRDRPVAGGGGGGSGQGSGRRALVFLSIAFVLAGIADFFAFQNTLPYLVSRGVTESVAGLALGFVALGYVVGQLAAGVLSDRSSREAVGTVSAILYVVGLVALWLSAGNYWAAMASAVVVGASVGGFIGAGSAAVGDLFTGSSIGKVSGIIMVADMLGGAAGSSLGAVGFDITGTYGLSFGIAAACVVLWITAIWAAAPRKARQLATATVPGDGCGSLGVSNKPLAPTVPLEQAVGANGLLAAPGSAPRTPR
jgi:MFS family permease